MLMRVASVIRAVKKAARFIRETAPLLAALADVILTATTRGKKKKNP